MIPAAMPRPDAARRLAGFCRALRRAGILVTLGEELDASRAILALHGPPARDFYAACRLALLKDPAQSGAFDAVFRSYWSRDPALQAILEDELSHPRPGMTHVPKDMEIVEGGGDLDAGLASSTDIARAIRAVLYSADAPSRPRVLRGIDRARLAAMQRRGRHLRRRIATLPGRRHHAASHGEVDFRRAARRSLRYAGEWVDLPMRARGPRRTRLLIVWDVSGSMEQDTEEHFALVYALQRLSRAARVFAFGTELHEVTGILRGRPYPTAVARMESSFTAWGGGTRIGESLAALSRAVASWVDRHTVVVILSDGWDIGNLTVLREAMSWMARRCGFIVWLSPYAGGKDFRPEVAGLQTALPYVDLLLSTDVLSDPGAFRRELGPSLRPLP